MSAAVPILMYHVVDDARGVGEGRLCCGPAEFSRQMAMLHASGWTVLSLSALVDAIAGRKALPARSAVISFDDGTACTFERALPVMQRFGYPGTVFMVAGMTGGRNEWMCRDGHPERRMLSKTQLRELVARGFEVGSHTVNHVRLAGLPPEVLSAEVGDSKRQLEDMIGTAVRHFAFPYGSFDAAAVEAVRAAGYESACSTLMGRNDPTSANAYALHRTEVKGDDALWQFRLKLHSGTHDMPPWSVPRAAVKSLLVRTGLTAGSPS